MLKKYVVIDESDESVLSQFDSRVSAEDDIKQWALDNPGEKYFLAEIISEAYIENPIVKPFK